MTWVITQHTCQMNKAISNAAFCGGGQPNNVNDIVVVQRKTSRCRDSHEQRQRHERIKKSLYIIWIIWSVCRCAGCGGAIVIATITLSRQTVITTAETTIIDKLAEERPDANNLANL